MVTTPPIYGLQGAAVFNAVVPQQVVGTFGALVVCPALPVAQDVVSFRGLTVRINGSSLTVDGTLIAAVDIGAFLNTWMFITVSFTGGVATLYINGVAFGSGAATLAGTAFELTTAATVISAGGFYNTLAWALADHETAAAIVMRSGTLSLLTASHVYAADLSQRPKSLTWADTGSATANSAVYAGPLTTLSATIIPGDFMVPGGGGGGGATGPAGPPGPTGPAGSANLTQVVYSLAGSYTPNPGEHVFLFDGGAATAFVLTLPDAALNGGAVFKLSISFTDPTSTVQIVPVVGNLMTGPLFETGQFVAPITLSDPNALGIKEYTFSCLGLGGAGVWEIAPDAPTQINGLTTDDAGSNVHRFGTKAPAAQIGPLAAGAAGEYTQIDRLALGLTSVTLSGVAENAVYGQTNFIDTVVNSVTVTMPAATDAPPSGLLLMIVTGSNPANVLNVTTGGGTTVAPTVELQAMNVQSGDALLFMSDGVSRWFLIGINPAATTKAQPAYRSTTPIGGTGTLDQPTLNLVTTPAGDITLDLPTATGNNMIGLTCRVVVVGIGGGRITFAVAGGDTFVGTIPALVVPAVGDSFVFRFYGAWYLETGP